MPQLRGSLSSLQWRMPRGCGVLSDQFARSIEVRSKGLEPSRPCGRQPLKLVRLPIPPRPRGSEFSLSNLRRTSRDFAIAGPLISRQNTRVATTPPPAPVTRLLQRSEPRATLNCLLNRPHRGSLGSGSSLSWLERHVDMVTGVRLENAKSP